MDWLRGITGGKSTSAKKSASRTTRKVSTERRFHVRNSDKRIVTAYKNPNGAGYVYHRRSASGTRNVPVNGNTYKTEKEAKEKVERLRKQAK